MVNNPNETQRHYQTDSASVRRILENLRSAGLKPVEAAGMLATALAELVMYLGDDGMHVPEVSMTIVDQEGNPREFTVSIRENG